MLDFQYSGNDICLVGSESHLLKCELCHVVNQHIQTKRVIPECSYRESSGQGDNAHFKYITVLTVKCLIKLNMNCLLFCKS